MIIFLIFMSYLLIAILSMAIMVYGNRKKWWHMIDGADVFIFSIFWLMSIPIFILFICYLYIISLLDKISKND